MKKKIIGIFVCMLLISTAIPVIGIESLQSEQNIELSPTTFHNLSFEIIKPKEKMFYMFDKEIIPFPWTVIIGPINFTGTCKKDEGIIVDRVEFHIYNKDGKNISFHMLEDPECPCMFGRDRMLFGQFTINFTAFDYDLGINASAEMKVWNFF